MLGPIRTFTAYCYFGLAEIRIVQQLLADNVTPPTGGFAITLSGIRQKLLEHDICLRPPTSHPPPRRDRTSGRRKTCVRFRVDLL